MNNSIFLRALCLIALIAALIGGANAQTTTEFKPGVPRTDNGVVGEPPATIYAIDTDGKDGLDIWTNDPDACAKAEVVECLPLENSNKSIIFEDKDGQDNVRSRTAPKVSATF